MQINKLLFYHYKPFLVILAWIHLNIEPIASLEYLIVIPLRPTVI